MLRHTNKSLYGLLETRWSARIESVGIADKLPQIIAALNGVKDECNLTSEGEAELRGFITYFTKFETIFLAAFWKDVLEKINFRNIILQSNEISLEVEHNSIESLKQEINSNMRSGWETYLKKAKEIAYELHITSPSTQFEMKRGRKRKTFFDEEEDCQLDDPQEYFKNSVFYATIDNIVS